jgi:hypothetical protein
MADEENETKSQEQYESISHELPAFKAITEDFDIEKVFEKDSNFVLRDIRHAIVEKITAYSQFFETLQNPSSAPMFIFALLRNTTEADKVIISEIYNKLAKVQIDSIKLDTIYSEQNEATFIKETHETWQDLKGKILKLIQKLEKETEKETTSGTKGYFG